MNQNRNNNRRRGRNNRGGGQGGGGNQGNRIDSRARGNAPQLLEKYRKLAHDASLNGDRVQTEYYLQYADHYFRVVADSRVQRDEQRPRHERAEGGRDQQQEYDYEDSEELGEAGGPAPSYQTRREREREEQQQLPAQEGEPALEGEPVDERGEDANPFVREGRGRRPRQRGREPVNGAEANGAQGNSAAAEEAVPAFDPGVLPPSIAREEEERPRPRRTRRPRNDDDGGSETLEAVG